MNSATESMRTDGSRDGIRGCAAQTWEGRTWNIVRADSDMTDLKPNDKPTRFTLESTAQMGKSGFRMKAVDQDELPECLTDVFLVPAGTVPPELTGVGVKHLPLYSEAAQADYSVAQDALLSYLDEQDDLMRLEGVIRMRGKDTGASGAAAPCHSVVNLYQFKEAVDDGSSNRRSLLVFWLPPNPEDPTNSDGTAIGYD